MAEKKGFFKRIFSFGSASEEERTPENGQMPRPNDTEVGRDSAPDPDLRPVAAAHVGADAEAGAENSDNGGITPLKEMERQSEESSATGGSAQKKTAQRSRWN
ncbi:hypothetical protein FP2506_10306 [Fulvimarina pelagi HTCC2506]|uniref:Uncharacterized protein n=1 Tax=Fulvimarina pelagi HTCC2506 TaxID=314231 RepID=Q0G535_9HYPH|nr:hypothetical protein [Fulvimarina pelagi]EAU43229.1 hypothetical protein FP2506_10306 [Fulvimarina pelagi HTCC2506]